MSTEIYTKHSSGTSTPCPECEQTPFTSYPLLDGEGNVDSQICRHSYLNSKEFREMYKNHAVTQDKLELASMHLTPRYTTVHHVYYDEYNIYVDFTNPLSMTPNNLIIFSNPFEFGKFPTLYIDAAAFPAKFKQNEEYVFNIPGTPFSIKPIGSNVNPNIEDFGDITMRTIKMMEYFGTALGAPFEPFYLDFPDFKFSSPVCKSWEGRIVL